MNGDEGIYHIDCTTKTWDINAGGYGYEIDQLPDLAGLYHMPMLTG
jgi:hypothetical protein